MNALPQHLLIKDFYGCVVDQTRSFDELDGRDDDFDLRHEDAVFGSAIPNAHKSVSCVFGHNRINKNRRHSVSVEGVRRHPGNPPSLNEGHQITSAWNRTKILDRGGNLLLRAAACIGSGQFASPIQAITSQNTLVLKGFAYVRNRTDVSPRRTAASGTHIRECASSVMSMHLDGCERECCCKHNGDHNGDLVAFRFHDIPQHFPAGEKASFNLKCQQAEVGDLSC